MFLNFVDAVVAFLNIGIFQYTDLPLYRSEYGNARFLCAALHGK